MGPPRLTRTDRPYFGGPATGDRSVSVRNDYYSQPNVKTTGGLPFIMAVENGKDPFNSFGHVPRKPASLLHYISIDWERAIMT